MAYTEYTQLKVKAEYRDRLKRIAKLHNRSMANMIEVLIDQADTQGTDLGLDNPEAEAKA